MNHGEPPRLAAWLLHYAAPGQRHEALTGDLLEEFRTGRSASWYWRQTLSALAIAISQMLLKRGPAMLFTVLWSALVPSWLLAIATAEKHFDLHQRFGQMDWPWSFVCDWGLLLAANLFFIWAGIALYLIVSLGTHKGLAFRPLVRGILASLPAIAALWATLVILPGMFIEPQFSRSDLTALGPLLNVHLAAILARLPFFIAILYTLWSSAPRVGNRNA